MTLDQAFGALSDPTRRAIIERLGEGPCHVSELAKHLAVLRVAGLVTVSQQGRQRVYALAPGALEGVDQWVSEASRFWDQALDRYKRFLEEDS